MPRQNSLSQQVRAPASNRIAMTAPLAAAVKAAYGLCLRSWTEKQK